MAAKFDLDDDGVVVVIGSGAGGGTLSNELAQKGVKVVCLEAGARHELTDFVKAHPGFRGAGARAAGCDHRTHVR